MDKFKSQELFNALNGKIFLNKYKVISLLDNGKSAAVFKAEDENGVAFALKVFDNEIVGKSGYEIQEKRIQKEIGLAKHSIGNLVKIITGGKELINGQEYYFIIMEFIEGTNLKNYLVANKYDEPFIKRVFATLYTVSEDLLKVNIVHRDIKPENIMVSNNGEIILMDLGVIKLIGYDSYSDAQEKQFLGTLRYAAPEFLTRQETDDIGGWRAINLYQIGGIMHDLIMKKELFSDREPYANLVIAIKEDAPEVSNNAYSYTTIQLTRNLLAKNHTTRLQLVSQEVIDSYINNEEKPGSELSELIDNFFKSSDATYKKGMELDDIKRSNEEKEKIKNTTNESLRQLFIQSLDILKAKGVIKSQKNSYSIKIPFDNSSLNRLVGYSVNLSGKYIVQHKNSSIKGQADNTFVFQIEGEYNRGFYKPFNLIVRIQNDENSLVTISLACFVAGIESQLRVVPQDMYKAIYAYLTHNSNPIPHTNPHGSKVIQLETTEIFNGVINYDEQTKQTIAAAILNIIKKVLDDLLPEVHKEIEYSRKTALGQPVTQHDRPNRMLKSKMYT